MTKRLRIGGFKYIKAVSNMRCIFFSGETCEVHPPLTRLAYKPTDEEKKNSCEHENFRSCTRYAGFIEYLKAMAKSER